MDGFLVRSDGTVDEAHDGYVACERCIKLGRAKWILEEDMYPLIEAFAFQPENQKRLLRRTPQIPNFAQRNDWAICCGQLCEYTGHPESYEEAKMLSTSVQFWDLGPSKWSDVYKDYELTPAYLGEVNTFKCRVCSKHGFTWQGT